MKYYLYYVMPNNNHIHYTLARIFPDKNALLHFLTWHQDPKGKFADPWFRKTVYRNEFLDNINMTGNDTYVYYDPNYNLALRTYMFMDNNGKVIDVRNFYDDIIAQNPKPHILSYDYWEKYHKRLNKRQRRKKHTTYGYRKFRYKHILYDRHECEHPEFIRKKYANSVSYYCDGIRTISGSWKDQSKKRHQWE